MSMLKSIITNRKFQLFAVLVFGGLFFGVADAQAVGWDARPGTVGESVSWYGAANACGAAQSGNTRMTMLIDWQDIPISNAGYYVDYKRSYNFNDSRDHWIWHKFIANPNTRNLITDGSDFVDSPYDGNTNGNTRDLVAGFAYYVQVYNVQNTTHYQVPAYVNIPVCGVNAFPTQPAVTGAPTCMGVNGYSSASINWGGRYDARLGYYVDISTSSSFATWYAKAVGNVTTTNFSGFTGYSGVSGPLTLQPSTTYYVRVFNGGNGHSTTRSFTTPASCPQPTCSSTSPNNYTVPYGTNSHTVSVQTSNVTSVNFAVYPAGQSPVWIAGTNLGSGLWSATINLNSFGSTYGQYYVDIYMNNANHSNIGCAHHPNFIRSALTVPTCSGAGPDGLVTYNDVGSHNIDITGVANATSVYVAMWSDIDGQDDLVWRPATNVGGGTWRLSSSAYNYSAHPGYSRISVHVYMNNSQVSNQFCDYADYERQRRPAPTITSVTTSVDPAACTNSPYTVNLAWTGQPRPAGQPLYTGFYVDASNSNLAPPATPPFWNKIVASSPTTAPTGMGPYAPSGASGTLTLQPGTTYYFRVYNDSHSNVVSVNKPRCGTISVEVDNPAGTWTLVHQTHSFTLNGTGTQLNFTVPAGTYTLTAHPLPGYNVTVDPVSVVVP